MIRRYPSIVAAALAAALTAAPVSSGRAQCSYQTLTPSTVEGTLVTSIPAYFSADMMGQCWSVVGLRAPLASDWDLALYDHADPPDYCVDLRLALSIKPPGYVDLVLANLHIGPRQTYFVEAEYGGGTSNSLIQWNECPDILTVNGTMASMNFSASSVCASYEVWLEAGTQYTLRFEPGAGTGYRLLLFGEEGGGSLAYFGRWNAALETTVSVQYTAPGSRFYCLVVVNDSGVAGSFRVGVGRCTPPVALQPETHTPAPGAQNYYSFDQDLAGWTVLGVQGAGDWDAEVLQSPTGGAVPECMSGLLARSAYGAGTTDFVVGDCNFTPTGTYYARAYLFGDVGTTPGHVEWVRSASALYVNGPWIYPTMSSIHFLEGHEIYLAAGTTYTFHFGTDGGADCKLLLFRNPGAGVYWAGRSSAVFSATTDWDYTPPASGFYLLVIVNDDGGMTTCTVGVGTCPTPDELDAGYCYPLDPPRDVFYGAFVQTVPYWTAVATNGATDTNDFDLPVYQGPSGSPWPTCFGSLLAASTYAGGYSDVVVGDYNHNPPGTFYARPYRYGWGPNPGAWLQWDSGTQTLAVNGPVLVHDQWMYFLVECWDVLLTGGITYTFHFSTSGPVNASLLLFRNPGSAPYWAARNDAVFSTSGGDAVYTAPTGDWYGVVLVSDNLRQGTCYIRVTTGTADVPEEPATPTALTGASPNPARGGARISFTLARPAQVEVEVHDMQGRRVSALAAGTRDAGAGSVEWDGRSVTGQRLPAGLYFVRMKVDGQVVGRTRLTLLE